MEGWRGESKEREAIGEEKRRETWQGEVRR